MKKTDAPHTHRDPKYRFLERHKTLTARPDVEKLANDIRQHQTLGQPDEVHALVHAVFIIRISD
jgi:hypothetical protein